MSISFEYHLSTQKVSDFEGFWISVFRFGTLNLYFCDLGLVLQLLLSQIWAQVKLLEKQLILFSQRAVIEVVNLILFFTQLVSIPYKIQNNKMFQSRLSVLIKLLHYSAFFKVFQITLVHFTERCSKLLTDQIDFIVFVLALHPKK